MNAHFCGKNPTSCVPDNRVSCTLGRVGDNPCFAVAGHFDALWLFLELLRKFKKKKKISEAKLSTDTARRELVAEMSHY